MMNVLFTYNLTQSVSILWVKLLLNKIKKCKTPLLFNSKRYICLAYKVSLILNKKI